MAIDLVKLGFSPDGQGFEEIQLPVASIIASNGESAEQHILNVAKHVPETSAANKNKILATLEDGSVGWVTPVDVDTKVSTGVNQSKGYTDTKIAELVNSAPETLDTLSEIADAIQSNQTTVQAINAAIGNKQDKVPATSNLLKGNGSAGGVVAATPGTDYVVPSGTVDKANKLATPRNIGIGGAVTGTPTSFDGSANITINATAVDATKLTGTVPAASIPNINADKITGLKADICYVTNESEIASKNLKPGGIVFMKV